MNQEFAELLKQKTAIDRAIQEHKAGLAIDLAAGGANKKALALVLEGNEHRLDMASQFFKLVEERAKAKGKNIDGLKRAFAQHVYDQSSKFYVVPPETAIRIAGFYEKIGEKKFAQKIRTAYNQSIQRARDYEKKLEELEK